MAQVVEQLPSKREALSSNSSTPKKKKKKSHRTELIYKVLMVVLTLWEDNLLNRAYMLTDIHTHTHTLTLSVSLSPLCLSVSLPSSHMHTLSLSQTLQMPGRLHNALVP
jgi:hypothetical protein